MKQHKILWISLLSLVAIVLIGLCFFKFVRINAAGPVISNFEVTSTSSINKYDTFEIKMNLSAGYEYNPYRNVYDYTVSITDQANQLKSETYYDKNASISGNGVDLRAYITEPGSSVPILVPGFWEVDGIYREDNYMAADSGGRWHVRYTPKKEGTYHYYIEALNINGEITRRPLIGTDSFTVNNTVSTKPNRARGFLTTDKDGSNNPTGYLEFEDGTPYTQFGVTNLSNGAQRIVDWGDNLAENGTNFMRYWLTNNTKNDIFRNNDSYWREDPKAKRDSSVFKSGKVSARQSYTSTQTKKTIVDQSYIGGKANTKYKATINVKTDSGCQGKINAYVKANNGRYWPSSSSVGYVNAPQTNWREVSFVFTTASDTSQLHFKPYITTTSTNCTVWIDDLSLYELNADDSIKYDFNQVWDPSFELTVTSSKEGERPYGNPAYLYHPNLWKFDEVIRQAEEKGIILQPTIFDYREWGRGKDSGGTCQLDTNGWPIYCSEVEYWAPFFGYRPYSDSSGVDHEFWNDPKSNAQAKRIIRYLIARYSHSPALGLWELANEMSPDYHDVRQYWITTMGQYIKDMDPHKHLVTNSYWYSPGDYRFEQLSQIDVSSVHEYVMTPQRYPTDPTKWNKDELNWAIGKTSLNESRYRQGQVDHNQPWLSGEFGLMGPNIGTDLSTWANPEVAVDSTYPRRDSEGIFIHNAVWSMLMANAFQSSVSDWYSAAFFGWTYSEDGKNKSKYARHYLAPSKFAKNLPFRDIHASVIITQGDTTNIDKIGENPANLTIVEASTGDSSGNIRLIGRKKDNQAYLWVRNKEGAWGNLINDGGTISDRSGTISVPGFATGQYNVKLFDTITGQEIEVNKTTVGSDGKLNFSVMFGQNFTTTKKPDVAVQITQAAEEPKITITKQGLISGGAKVAYSGSTVSFFITVKNTTTSSQTINLTDPVPGEYFSQVSADQQGTVQRTSPPNTYTVTWPAFTLLPNEQKVFKVFAKVRDINENDYKQASLSGIIYDSSGKVVLSGANITISSLSDSVANPPISATSSSEGVFTMNYLEGGYDHIKFEKTGFNTIEGSLVLNSASVFPKRAELNLALSPGSGTEYVHIQTILAGNNFFSLPINPTETNPAQIFSYIVPNGASYSEGVLDVNGLLTRLDYSTNGWITYRASEPNVFGTMTGGLGYSLTSNLSTPKTVTIKGTLNDFDAKINLPRAGKNYIGVPWSTPNYWGNVIVTKNTTESKTFAEAITAGWITKIEKVVDAFTGNGQSLNLTDQQLKYLPGVAYWITTGVNDLEINRPSQKIMLLDDTYTRADNPSTVYGISDPTHLRVDGSPKYNTFLKFEINLAQLTNLKKASVRIKVDDNGSVVGGSIRKIDNNSWSKAVTTYNNQPEFLSFPILSSIGSAAIGSQQKFDITSAISVAGIYSFCIDSENGDGIVYHSKDATAVENKPYLLLEY